MALNHDALKQRRAGSSGGSTWKPKDGPNRVRILPPHSKFLTNWDALEDFAVTYKMHYFHLEGRPTEVSLCLEQLKQRCPACEVWRVQRKSEDAGMKELARQIGPSDSYLFNILDMNNLQKGIQPWAANYTCWDKIMEVGGNPAWGNVIDPEDGLDFEVTLTPASKSRTKNNAYSVMPVPGGVRTNVMPVLEAIENWQDGLDHLREHIKEAKTAEEIRGLLQEIGFPVAGKPAAAAAPVGVALPVTAAPKPVAAAKPVAAKPAAAPVAAGKPAAAKPAAVAPKPVAAAKPVAVAAPKPVAAKAKPAPVVEEEVAEEEPEPEAVTEEGVEEEVGASEDVTVPEGVHYDPGPDYEPVTPEDERPEGAPRCYGDYKPQVHECQPCPLVADCQMKLLGIN